MNSKALLFVALALAAVMWQCEAQRGCFRRTQLRGARPAPMPANETETEETLGLAGPRGRPFPPTSRCTLRSSSATIVRYFFFGGRRRRCVGRVRLNSCAGNCFSTYALTSTGVPLSRCQCCKPASFRQFTQNIVLNCGGCAFYNYRFQGVTVSRCRCQGC